MLIDNSVIAEELINTPLKEMAFNAVNFLIHVISGMGYIVGWNSESIPLVTNNKGQLV